jgi:hypothetical protein
MAKKKHRRQRSGYQGRHVERAGRAAPSRLRGGVHIQRGERHKRRYLGRFTIRSAYQRGHELVKDSEVQALLKQRREQIASKLKLTTETVLRRLAEIIEADITQLLDAKGNILPVKAWPAEVRRAVRRSSGASSGPRSASTTCPPRSATP